MNLKDLINDKNTTIVDVRTEVEFNSGNIEGSINIPLDEVLDRVEELKAMQPIIMCCLSGGRSGQATAYLKSSGCEDVYNDGCRQSLCSFK